jgi:outer membrane protein assembly factor BamB
MPYCAGGYYGCTIAGASGNVLVVSVQGFTVALDVTTRKPLWTSYSVHAMAVAGDQVIGAMAVPGPGAGTWSGNGFHLVGLDLRTGRVAWNDQDYTYFSSDAPATDPAIMPVGPAEAVVAGSHGVQFLNAATGVPVKVVNTGPTDHVSCLYDDVSVVICQGNNGDTAYDAVSGRLLWSLPSASQTSVAVSAAWHGVVYGRAVNSTFTAVVLDARTGRVRELHPGIAPSMVDQFAGFSGNLAYGAIG